MKGMRKRSFEFLLLAMFALVFAALAADSALAEKTIRLTFAGDVTLGSEEALRDKAYSLDSFAQENGYAYFFERVQALFAQDDLTIVNLEGVLSDSSADENTQKTYRFRGPAAFAQILTQGSVEMVNLANNHTLDYGERGLADTKAALEGEGVAFFGNREIAVYEKDGVRIAFLGLSYSDMRRADREWAREEIARLRSEEGVDAVVFTFHAGREYSEARTEKQQEYALQAQSL